MNTNENECEKSAEDVKGKTFDVPTLISRISFGYTDVLSPDPMTGFDGWRCL